MDDDSPVWFRYKDEEFTKDEMALIAIAVGLFFFMCYGIYEVIGIM